jgi:hypothetical protein
MNDWYAAFDALQLITLVSQLLVIFVVIGHKSWISEFVNIFRR